jgi:hypothetical protein
VVIRNGQNALDFIHSWEVGCVSKERIRWMVQIALEGARCCLGLSDTKIEPVKSGGYRDAIFVFEKYLGAEV